MSVLQRVDHDHDIDRLENDDQRAEIKVLGEQEQIHCEVACSTDVHLKCSRYERISSLSILLSAQLTIGCF